jgi:G:T/U-mismatch repair DNA glycosylase
MPKKIAVSLHGIVKQIDLAARKLSDAERRAITGAEKRKLRATIKALKKARVEVIKRCGGKSYGIAVPV